MKGILFGLALLIGAFAGWPGVIGITGIVGICLLAGGRGVRWMLAGIPVAVIGCLRVFGGDDVPGTYPPNGEMAITGIVISRPVENSRTQRFDVSFHDGTAERRLCVDAPLLPEIRFGDRVRISGTVRWIIEVDERYAGYLRSRQCDGALNSTTTRVLDKADGVLARLDELRRRLNAALQRAAPGDAGVLLSGLVTGDDSALPADRRGDFITTGTSHVTAVSGSNLALIATILALAGNGLGIARRWPWLLLVAVTLWFYVGVIGPSPPALRAAMVATLAILATLIGRRPDFVTLSVMVAATELLIRPSDFATLSFRLSTISALALVLAMSGRTVSTWRGWLGTSIFATAATQAATSVILIPQFGRFAVYAIPANLLIGPLCTLAFPLALIAAIVGVVSPPLAAAIAAPAEYVAAIVIAVVGAFADLPGANWGAALGGSVPGWAWGILGLSAVILLSRECRGGILRSSDELRSAGPWVHAVMVGAALGIALGACAGVAAR
ncbi:MAG: ComEC/Rec2 family competence protein [Thermomicrobiales bacterium]|nr:ComEC/Rec2 family competence protein [Thermomicrobiales bacterium]